MVLTTHRTRRFEVGLLRLALLTEAAIRRLDAEAWEHRGTIGNWWDRFAEYGIRRRTGALLTGPPGTGKTTIGRILARELLNQLDGLGGDDDILTLATTDRPDALDQAIRDRPGRFDRRIEVPPPPRDVCEAFLTARLGRWVEAEAIATLADRAAGATGAALEELANTAILLALQGQEGDGDGSRESEGKELRIGPEILEAVWERFQFVTRQERLGF